MVIIGFVITVMISGSFAIVFNNSGNIQNTSNKQILNLPEKSFTSNVTKTVTMSNAINSPIAPIEFYSNFMVYVDTNNYIYITNLSSGLNVNTTLIFNNVDFNAYYGLIIHNNYLYLYYINNNFLLYVYSYTLDNLVNINLNTLSLPDSPDGNLGLTANSNGIYDINVCYTGSGYELSMYEINYNASLITYKKFTNITYSSSFNENYNFYTMGNFLTLTDENAGDIYLLNLNNLNIYQLKGSENYGEMIYNNTYQNNFKTIDNLSLNNIYISNHVSYGCIYNYIKPTDIIEPELYNNRQDVTNNLDVSFIEANFYNNAYVNSSGYLRYNNSYAVKLGSYTLPYTILNNSIYYAINSYTYGIEYLNTYILNITSYNHNSNQIKDYFFYNNNIYYGNEFNFTNANGIYSLLPLNYSIYTYNNSYIITTSTDFKYMGNGIYQYNLTIYYNQLSTNSQLPKNPIAFGSYTELLTYLFIFFAVISLVFMTKKYGFDNNSKRGKK